MNSDARRIALRSLDLVLSKLRKYTKTLKTGIKNDIAAGNLCSINNEGPCRVLTTKNLTSVSLSRLIKCVQTTIAGLGDDETVIALHPKLVHGFACTRG